MVFTSKGDQRGKPCKNCSFNSGAKRLDQTQRGLIESAWRQKLPGSNVRARAEAYLHHLTPGAEQSMIFLSTLWLFGLQFSQRLKNQFKDFNMQIQQAYASLSSSEMGKSAAFFSIFCLWRQSWDPKSQRRSPPRHRHAHHLPRAHRLDEKPLDWDEGGRWEAPNCHLRMGENDNKQIGISELPWVTYFQTNSNGYIWTHNDPNVSKFYWFKTFLDKHILYLSGLFAVKIRQETSVFRNRIK